MGFGARPLHGPSIDRLCRLDIYKVIFYKPLPVSAWILLGHVVYGYRIGRNDDSGMFEN